MALDNCKQCGKPFNRVRDPLCDLCQELHEAINRLIYHIIQENPGISLLEIAEKVNLSLQEVQKRIFSGDLGTASQLVKSKCGKCGCEIYFYGSMNNFCEKCTKSMNNQLSLERDFTPATQQETRIGMQSSRRRGDSDSTYGFGRR